MAETTRRGFQFILLSLLVASGLEAATPGFAQVPTPPAPAVGEPLATLQGHVTRYEDGTPVQRAFVTLTSPAVGGQGITVTTDGTGSYLARVPAGIWNVNFHFMLDPPRKVAGVVLRAGETTDLDTALSRDLLIDVRGQVVSNEDGQPLPGANVSITRLGDTTGKVWGARTDPEGRFSLTVPPGRYDIAGLFFLYQKKIVTVEVTRLGVAPVRVALESAAVQTKEIVVNGIRSRNTKVAELQTRKKSDTITDGISRDLMRKTTDSDAGQVMKRVTGVSVKDGKYLIIRGLSERYASTALNGVRVASPEPNRKIVPLDMFPAGLLDNITVQKAYTPDQPGEFGGGAVQISTREIPEKPVWAQTYATGLSSNAGEAGLGYAGGHFDLLGIDDGTRGLPDLINAKASHQLIKEKGGLSPNGPGFSKADMLEIARSFNDQWAPTASHYRPAVAFSQAAGRRLELFGHPVGVVGSASWSRGLNTVQRDLNFYQDVSLEPKALFRETRTTSSVLWGGTGTTTYRFSDASSLKAGLFYSRSADDEARAYRGQDFDRLAWYRAQRLLYVQRSIVMGTLGGDHPLPILKSRLEWKLNRSRAERDEPDRRENGYEGPDFSTPLDPDTLGNNAWRFTGATRLYSEVADHEKGGEGSLAIPFRAWGDGAARFRLGYQRQAKERSSWTRRFEYRGRSVDPYAPIDSILQNANIQKSVSFIDATNGTDLYFARQSLSAGYLMVEMPLSTRLRLTTGARVEHSIQSISTYTDIAYTSPLKTYGLDDTDVLPALNLTWALDVRSNFRFAASQTVSRPDLRELTDFSLPNYVGGYRDTGNPALKRGKLQSLDLRWETFPALDELFAASLFYKKLVHPIERAIQGGSAPNTFPINAEQGVNYGLELEARTGLTRLIRPLKRWALNGNLTLVHTEAQIPRTGVSTSVRHPLEGQSKYVANLGVFYTSPGGGTEAGVFYNTYGRRLAGVGIYGQPDIYERAQTAVDLNWSQRVGSGLKVKLGAKNVLNQARVIEQGGRIRESYRPGASFSLALGLGS